MNKIINVKKIFALLIITLILIGTQTLAVTVERVTGLEVTSVFGDTANISWNAVSGAKGYEIYVNVPNLGYTCIGTTTSTRVRILGFQEGITYYAKIRAYKEENGIKTYGEFSNEVEITNKVLTDANLEQVKNLNAEVLSSTDAKLKWSAVSGAEGYEIYVNVIGLGYVYVGSVPTTDVIATGFEENIEYYAKVRAYKLVNGTKVYGEFSNEVKIVTTSLAGTKPEQVQDLKVMNVTDSSVSLAWSAVSEAEGYEIYLSVPGEEYINKKTTTETNINITELKTGIAHYAKVRAYKMVNGNKIYGDFSSEVKFVTLSIAEPNNPETPSIPAEPSIPVTPSNPAPTQTKPTSTPTSSPTQPESLDKVTGLRVTNITDTSADISWDQVSGASLYMVYAKMQDKGFTVLGIQSATSLKYTKLEPETTYNVMVIALKIENGKTIFGEFSNIVTFTTSSTASQKLGKVTDLRAVDISSTYAQLTWTSVPEAQGYEVFINAGQGYVSRGTVIVTSIKFSGCQPGTTYSVKVRPYKEVDGNIIYGDDSNEVTFTTKTIYEDQATQQLEKVMNVKIDGIRGTDVYFSWDPVPGAQGYEVLVGAEGQTYNNLGRIYSTSGGVRNCSPGITYYVKIKAFREENGVTVYGATSNAITFRIEGQQDSYYPPIDDPSTQNLGQVTGVRVLGTTSSSANLAWNPVSGAEGYEVYVDISIIGYVKAGTFASTVGNVDGFQPGETYYAKVRAYKTVNGTKVYGEFSNEVVFITQGSSSSSSSSSSSASPSSASSPSTSTTVDKVTNVKVGRITKDGVNLSWNPVIGADGYEVYVDISIIGYVKAGNFTNARGYVDGFQPGETYYAKVRAYKMVNGTKVYGDFSTEVVFTTKMS